MNGQNQSNECLLHMPRISHPFPAYIIFTVICKWAKKKQSSLILLNYQFFICDKNNMHSQSPPSPPLPHPPHPLTPNFSTTSFIFSGEKQHILPSTTKALLFILTVLIAFTCTKCWNFWHTLGLHIHMVFLLCALVHGFSDCKKLGKPFHILPGHK